MDLEMTKTNAEAREERKRLNCECLEVRERLERSVLDHQKNPALDAIVILPSFKYVFSRNKDFGME